MVYRAEMPSILERIAEIFVAAVHLGGPQDFEPPAKPPQNVHVKNSFLRSYYQNSFFYYYLFILRSN